MTVVTELLSGEPGGWSERHVERDEAQLFELPPAGIRKFLGAEFEPLAVYTYPAEYAPTEFGPPRGVFEGPALRLEWQTMTGRQPFYHRNADVDEIGFQVAGQRSLITERGTVDFKRGQFSRIPAGVAHDNACREDIHLIFYMHGPVELGMPVSARAQRKIPPFPGWAPSPMVEALTNAMGGPGGAIGYSMVDENLILANACDPDDFLEILEPSAPSGEVVWVYRAPKVWIGHTRVEAADERRYRRYVAADEIQYQSAGRRTVVSQRGVVTLEPADFTLIPRGCAYASVAEGASEHLSVLVTEPTPACRPASRTADPDVKGWLAKHRTGVLERAE